MKTCVVYFSRTGNTKRFGEAIAKAANTQSYDLTTISPQTLQDCDLLIIGTPVEGASPAKETLAFIEGMPQAENKKLVLFCTYKVFGNERTMKKMEKVLGSRGYKTILKISKKGMTPNQEADFSEQIAEVKKVIEQ